MEKALKIILTLTLIFSQPLICFAAWVDADKEGQEEVEVVDTTGTTTEASIESDIDSLSRSHIVWADDADGTEDIYYLWYNGTEWVDADGSGQESMKIYNTGGTDYARDPSIALDSQDHPWIAFWTSDVGLGASVLCLYWDGSVWTQSSVYTDNSGGPSIEINPINGLPGVVFLTGGSEIFYLWYNGSSWVDADGSGQESIKIWDQVGASSPSLQYDSSNRPMIAWGRSSGGFPVSEYWIYYLYYIDGTGWVDADGSGTESIQIYSGNTERYPSMVVNPSDCPVIAWYNTTASDIYYLQFNGTSWVDADGSGQGEINITNTGSATAGRPSLKMTSDGNPAVAYAGTGGIHYLEWNGTSWTDADGSGTESSLIYNSTGTATSPSLNLDSRHIAWLDDSGGNRNPYYLEWPPDSDLDVLDNGDILPETGMDFVDYVNGLLL